MRLAGRQVLSASAVLLLLLGVLLWKPTVSDRYYASADLLQSSPLLRVAPEGYRYGNLLITDPVQQMYPWLEWNRDRIRDGDLPAWNPYNGAGAPHLANYVSAVYSPFSVPFYVLPVRLALVAAAGLKLFVLGLFTYLFLRRVRVSHLGALVGAVAFMFSGYHVLWLSWPHPAAVVCLPAGLYFAETAIQAASRRQRYLAWSGYTAALLAAFLAGHPESMFFSWGLVLLYVPLRVAVLRRSARERLAMGAELLGAGVLAAGLAAVQLLPFVEYLGRSTAYAEGSTRAMTHFDWRFRVLDVFPNLFGNPSQRFYDPARLNNLLRLPDGTPAGGNYNEAAGTFVGVLVLVLAATGVASLLRRRTFPALFLAIVAVGWQVYVHGLGGISRAVGSLPLVELSIINRSQPIWLFAVAGLAGFGVDWIRTVARPAMTATAVGAFGVAVLGVAAVAARDLRDRTAGAPGALSPTPLTNDAVRSHLVFVALTLLVGLAAIGLLTAVRGGRFVPAIGAVALVGTVFAQSGFLLRDYNPAIEGRYFYPVSPAMDAVQRAVGAETVALDRLLSPDANLWYRLRTPASYDGVGVASHDLLTRRLQALPEPLRSERLAQVYGVRWAAAAPGYPFGTPLSAVVGPRPLAGDRPVVEPFTSGVAGLDSVVALANPVAPGGPCRVDLTIEDQVTGQVVARASEPCRLPFAVLGFPPQANSAGRSYRAVFRGQGVLAAMYPWAGGVGDTQQFDAGDVVGLFRVPGSPDRYFSPGRAIPVDDDEQALAQLSTSGFDVASSVLIHGRGVTESTGPAGRVEVLGETATRIRLRVKRATAGWLVALQTYYPGWEATVDGRRAPLRRANVSFSAVPVPVGTSEVVLRYAPRSVRNGLAVSGVSLAVGVVLLGAGLRRHPSDPHVDAVPGM